MSNSKQNANLPELQSEFKALLRKQLDQELSDQEERRLDELLDAYPAFREVFVEQTWTDTLLQWSMAGNLMGETERNPLACSLAPASRLQLKPYSPISGSYARPISLALGLLLLVGVAAYWGRVTTVHSPAGTQNVVEQFNAESASVNSDSAAAPEMPAQGMAAILLDSEDAVWEGTESHIDYGRSFPEGRRLSLKSGLARLAFACGAGVTLEGPAVLELCSGWQACLHRGKLAAIVPEGAEGFTVLTPQKRIIDLGTKFGAEVDDSGQASVQVYEGEVKVESREEKPRQSFLMTPVSLPRYSESRSDMPEIHLRGVDSSESVSVPTLEQLMVAKTGVYPPRRSSSVDSADDFLSSDSAQLPPNSTIPAGVLLGMDFTPVSRSGGQAQAAPLGMRLNSEFCRIVTLPEALQWGAISGGHYALEISGRDPAYPSIANRMDLELPEPIRDEVYFSFLARYQGLDETDFFALWFDNNRGEGMSHSTCPNAGIRFGDYFARMQVHQESVLGNPEDNAVFFLVGRLLKNEQGEYHAMELWLNPELGSEEPPLPDVRANTEKPARQAYSVIGLRMGKDTEPDDRLYLDRLVIGKTFHDVTETFQPAFAPAKQRVNQVPRSSSTVITPEFVTP